MTRSPRLKLEPDGLGYAKTPFISTSSQFSPPKDFTALCISVSSYIGVTNFWVTSLHGLKQCPAPPRQLISRKPTEIDSVSQLFLTSQVTRDVNSRSIQKQRDHYQRSKHRACILADAVVRIDCSR